jgi:hypothetical protein
MRCRAIASSRYGLRKTRSCAARRLFAIFGSRPDVTSRCTALRHMAKWRFRTANARIARQARA